MTNAQTKPEPKPHEPFDPKRLPAAGAGRFWRIEHQPKNRREPIKISLMEQLGETRHPKFANLVGFGGTSAIPEMIYDEAQLILDRTGRAREVVGDYDGGAA